MTAYDLQQYDRPFKYRNVLLTSLELCAVTQHGDASKRHPRRRILVVHRVCTQRTPLWRVHDKMPSLMS